MLKKPEAPGNGNACGVSEQDFLQPGNRSLQDFTGWVMQTLEAANFTPVHPGDAQVVILPLSQLLGRPMQAVVLPGCDEIRLAVSPEPPGQRTPAQRELLGLPSRDELAAAPGSMRCRCRILMCCGVPAKPVKSSCQVALYKRFYCGRLLRCHPIRAPSGC